MTGFQVQQLGSADNRYVQIKKGGIWRTVLGLDRALTVHISNTDNVSKISLGQAKWADKAAVEAVGFLVFWPLMIPSSYGLYEQHKLPGQIWKTIDDYLSSHQMHNTLNERIVEAIHCPHCGVTNASEAQYCSACGSPLKPA